MPPKKVEPAGNKKGQGQQLLDEDYSDLHTCPPINNFTFTCLYSFKYKANQVALQSHLLKLFLYQQEDPLYQKIRVIQKEDIINLAKLKMLITEEESLDISKLPYEKYVEVFAKITNDLVLQAEVPLRRQKRELFANMNDQQKQDHNQSKLQEVEMLIWLKDFPSNLQEYKAFLSLKQNIYATFVIDEQFAKEEEEPQTLNFQSSDPAMQLLYEEQQKALQEKLKYEATKVERVKVYNNLIDINKIFKFSQEGSELRMCSIHRLRFQGPDPPRGEQLDHSEEQKFVQFAQEFKQKVEELSVDLQEYRLLAPQVKTVPLMPYPIDPRQQKKQEEEERLRQERVKQEEEKKQQEALLLQQQQQKGAKPGQKQPPPQAAKPSAQSALSQQQEEQKKQQEQEEEEQRKRLSQQQNKRNKDEEEKEWNFQHLDKMCAEMKGGHMNIGSLLAAMIHQIAHQNINAKKGGGQASKNQNSDQGEKMILKGDADENMLSDYFDDVFNKLAIEHSMKETGFHHEYKEQVVQPQISDSPYQSIFNEKDIANKISSKYTFLNGDPQSKQETKILSEYQLPGVNKRIGMPATPLINQAQRESDLGAIIQYCQMSTSQTKRSLILREFETLFKSKEPERSFNFLDRNYLETYDSLTLRQELVQALKARPEMITSYYERDDALLLAVYFKNPPGRLLRKQWTQQNQRCFPDFQTWQKYVKKEGIQLNMKEMLEVPKHKIGFIRTNTKFSYPSDNSIIRVDKHEIGSRRLGSSLVIKDNLTFGIREKLEAFNEKGGEEENFLSREAQANTDRRCELWLEFENGTKLQVEMQDHIEGGQREIPLFEPLPMEEQIRIQNEQKRQQELLEQLQKIQEEQQKKLEEPPSQQVAPAGGKAGAVSGKDSGLNKNDSKKTLPTAKEAQLKAQQEKERETLAKSDSQKQLLSIQQELQQIQDSQLRMQTGQDQIETAPHPDGYDSTKGAKMTFTFEEGLIVQILPNGDVCQTITENPSENKKFGGTIQDSKLPGQQEKSRVFSSQGQLIRYFMDGNMAIYYPDGTVTSTDKRKGIWYTVNPKGVKRVRKLKEQIVYDEPKRLKISEKIDPETSATVQIREDGVLIIKYVDQKRIVMMPDGTQIFTMADSSNGGSFTIITKEGFAPVRIIYDPVKARAKTVIGLGGTDSMMGIETIMERTNSGRITEVILPDKTQIQSYLERQELEGYNNFCTNMVHLIRRDDFSIFKIKQDGEVVMISANQRGYLNDIGKQMELGKNDYDYFFEMFGIPSERRSGVYTANLDKGKLWTQDEEGNVFIIYANGDSVEKLSVSFDLDQMVEGIENKEPSSPKIKDGEFVEEECKFLPPPKTVAHPRLFMINSNEGGVEYLNEEQLAYLFRCKRKDSEQIQSVSSLKVENEDAKSHLFLKKNKEFELQRYLEKNFIPKIPQSVELINQTVSIQKDPVKEEYLLRNIFEFNQLDNSQIANFNQSIQKYIDLRKAQKSEKQRLKINDIKSDDFKQQECKIWMRIAKERQLDVSKMYGEEYKLLKEVIKDEKRKQFLEDLDNPQAF